ncbi:MAG: tetratricopeptide (TPR) repeat protein [Candidatus Omnitrophota bacterium]|jgi:tetratricopeptide (TPR) repeat protein
MARKIKQFESRLPLRCFRAHHNDGNGRALWIGALSFCIVINFISDPRIAYAEEPGLNTAESVRFDEKLDFARGLYMRDIFDMALEEYQTMIQAHPNHPDIVEAHIGMSDTYFAEKKYDLAIQAYRNLLNKFPEYNKKEIAAERVAEALFFTNRQAESKQLFMTLKESEDKVIQQRSTFFIARILFDDSSWDEAEKYFEIYLERIEHENSFFLFTNYYLGEIEVQRGDYEIASEYLSIALESDNAQIKQAARFTLGKMYFKQNDFLRSAEYFKAAYQNSYDKLIQQDAYVNYLHSLSKAELNTKLIEVFEADADQVLEKKALAEAGLFVADSLRRNSQFDKSITQYKKIAASELASDEVRQKAILGLIELFIQNEQPQVALDVIQKTNPEDWLYKEARTFLHAQALSAMNESEKALELYAELMQMDIEADYTDDAYLAGIYLQLKLKQYSKAMPWMEEFVQKFSKHPMLEKIVTDLVLVDLKDDNFVKAVEHSKLALSLLADGSDQARKVEFRLASLYGEINQYQKADDLFNAYQAKYSDKKDINELDYSRGVNFQQWGKMLEAIQSYSRIELKSINAALAADVLVNKAYCAIQIERDDLAAASYYQLIIDYPQKNLENEIYLWTIDYLKKNNAPDKVLAVLEALPEESRVVEYKSQFAYYKAEAYRLKGEHSLAVAQYELSIASPGPMQGEGYYGLGESYFALGEWSGAVQAFESAMKHANENHRLATQSRMYIGKVHFANQDYLDSAKAYFAVAILYDDIEFSPEALFMAARGFKMSGNDNRAKKVYTELVTRYSEHPRAIEAQKILKQL